MDISRAWVKVTGSHLGKLRLTDTLLFFDVLEEMMHTVLLSDEYREFIVEFILECPGVEVTQSQFRLLMERLFECTIDDVLQGSLVNKERDSDDYTKTMNIESQKFNSFLSRGTNDEREDGLRKRIEELENMISKAQMSKSRDDKTLTKMKDVLVNYYKNLVQLIESRATPTRSTDPYLERLKSGIDKQDVLIKELKRKVGDKLPSGVWGSILRVYAFLLKMFKYGAFIVFVIIIIQISLSLVYDGDYSDDYEDELVW